MLVVDSFKALGFYAADQGEFRRFLHSLSGRLSAFPVTSLWLGEYDPAELTTAPEFAVADAIVSLTSDRTSQRELRILQVLKLRGSGFCPANMPTGCRRLASMSSRAWPTRWTRPPTAAHRADLVGHPSLDAMLTDGYWPGRLPGRRPLGRRQDPHGPALCRRGARRAATGIIATLQENPTQLARVAQGFGWSLAEDGIELLYRSRLTCTSTSGSTSSWQPSSAPAPDGS